MAAGRFMREVGVTAAAQMILDGLAVNDKLSKNVNFLSPVISFGVGSVYSFFHSKYTNTFSSLFQCTSGPSLGMMLNVGCSLAISSIIGADRMEIEKVRGACCGVIALGITIAQILEIKLGRAASVTTEAPPTTIKSKRA